MGSPSFTAHVGRAFVIRKRVKGHAKNAMWKLVYLVSADMERIILRIDNKAVCVPYGHTLSFELWERVIKLTYKRRHGKNAAGIQTDLPSDIGVQRSGFTGSVRYGNGDYGTK